MKTLEERKVANRKAQRKYHETHRDILRERSRKWAKEHPNKVRDNDLKRVYGITIEEYNQRLINQNGVCIICGNPPGKRALGVDHDHTTGKIRGLLCRKCNSILGYINDNTTVLRKAIDYLENGNEV